LRAVADDPVLAQPQIAVRDGPARAGCGVDVDPGLGRTREREPIREPCGRVPEGSGAAVPVEKPLRGDWILGDDAGGEARGLLVGDAYRFLQRARVTERHLAGLEVVGPFVADGKAVERFGTVHVPAYAQPQPLREGDQVGDDRGGSAVDEAEVE